MNENEIFGCHAYHGEGYRFIPQRLYERILRDCAALERQIAADPWTEAEGRLADWLNRKEKPDLLQVPLPAAARE